MSSQVLGEMDFNDLSPVVVPVKIDGKRYELRDADADAARQWGNAKARGMKFDDGKMTGVDGVADCEPLLVSLCLVEILGPATFKAVPYAQVLAWPSRIVGPLYKRALEISELEDSTPEALEKQIVELQKRLEKARKESAKNVPAPSTATST